MFHVSGKEELAAPAKGPHALLAAFQEKIAFLPDYGFKKPEKEAAAGPGDEQNSAQSAKEEESWPAVSTGTSVSGLVGGAITLILAGLVGFGLRKYQAGRR